MTKTQETWAQLIEEASRNGTHGGVVRLRVHPNRRPSVFLAIERPSNTPLLLLRLRRHSVPPAHRLPSADGFIVSPVVQPDDDDDHATIVIRLMDVRYADIFSALVDDVIAAILPSTDDSGLIRELIARLSAWQRFLAAHGPQGLGAEAQQGLYGELYCLRSYVLPHFDPLTAVTAWTGPSSAIHDFQLPNCAIEVKTSTAKQLQSIRISSERQLDDTYVSALWLTHYSLDVSQSCGESLVEIVASVRAIIECDAVARQAFDDRLWSVGYTDVQADIYQDIRYQIRNQSIFRVSEGFPRIVEQELRSGVGDVQYSVSVAACVQFAISTDAFITNLIGDLNDGA